VEATDGDHQGRSGGQQLANDDAADQHTPDQRDRIRVWRVFPEAFRPARAA
jgi:hypothetical protein